jgi:signal transduction histidine kinase
MEQGIYRIAQEALTNVARHADATHLAVSLQCNGAIALTIQDNGRGFDVSSIDAGWALWPAGDARARRHDECNP